MASMFYEDVLRALVGAGARFVIVGGVAVNLHGVPRMTADLDLLVDLTPDNLLLVIQALEDLGYRPRAPVNPRDLADESIRKRWIEEKSMRAFSFIHPDHGFMVVDLLVDTPVPFAEVAARTVTVEADDLKLPVASIEDLLELKRDTGRVQDQADSRELERLRRRRSP